MCKANEPKSRVTWVQLNWFQNAQLLLKVLPKVQYTFTHDQQTPCKASGRPYDFSISIVVISTAKLRLFRCFLVAVLFEFCFIMVMAAFALLLLFTFLMSINRSFTSFLLWIRLLLSSITLFVCQLLFLDYVYSHNFPCRHSCISCHFSSSSSSSFTSRFSYWFLNHPNLIAFIPSNQRTVHPNKQATNQTNKGKMIVKSKNLV